MKYNDIIEVFSQIVAEKLNNHCVLCLDDMHSWSNKELAHIDYIDPAVKVTNPNHMYRVFVEKRCEFTDAGKLEIIVIKLVYFDDVDSCIVVWNDKGKCIFEKKYYKVGCDYWIDNEQKFEEVVKIRSIRRTAKAYNRTKNTPLTTDKLVNLATKYVKHHVYRYANNVQVFKQDGCYYVTYDKKNGDKAFAFIFLAK